MIIELDLEEERKVQNLLNHESFFDPRYIESKFGTILRDLELFSKKLYTLNYLAKVYPKDDTNFIMNLFDLINKNLYFWGDEDLIKLILGKNYKKVVFLIDVPEPSSSHGFYFRSDISLAGYSSMGSSINSMKMYSKEEMFDAIKNHELIVTKFLDECNYRRIGEREYKDCINKRAEFSFDCKSAYNIATNYPEIVSHIREFLTKKKLNTFLSQYRKIYKNILKGTKIAVNQYLNSSDKKAEVELLAKELSRKLITIYEQN